MSELPKAWELLPLQDCVFFQEGPGLRKWQFGASGIPFLNIRTFNNGTIDKTKCQFVKPEEFNGKYEHFLLAEGDIVVSSSGTLGKLVVVQKQDLPLMLNTSVIRYRSLYPENLLQSFLKFFLQSHHFFEQISSAKTGSAILNYGPSHIKEMNILVPPVNEQHRIVAKLEKLLSRVDAAQARLATIPRILKRFRQSVLAAACSGRLTADWRAENPKVEPATIIIERLKATAPAKVRRGVPERVQVSDLVADWDLPETWESYSAAELLRSDALVDVKDGNHGANHPKVSEFTKTGLPFITAAQVNNYRIDYDGAYKLSGEPLKRIRVGFAKSGDVIFTHKGSVGRVAVANRDCVLTPQTTYYRVNPRVFSNRFVMFYLASQSFSEQVDVVKEQTTRDFVPISEQYLLFHRVPPLAEQQVIVRRIEALFKTADALEARYRTAKAHVDKLTQSVLAKAFRGELVPQDPNDEPASALLERIRQNKDATGVKKRSVGR